METSYTNRDISWLSFNERVLDEALKSGVPLLERLKFLSIYSSNLDEFYRVRMPAIMALKKIKKTEKEAQLLEVVKSTINRQQQLFGKILTEDIIPDLQQHGIHFLYKTPLPETIEAEVRDLFFTQIAAFLQPVQLSEASNYFPENNKIYLVADLLQHQQEQMVLVPIPSNELGRFQTMFRDEKQYVVTLDDIIRAHLAEIFPHALVRGCYSIKVTRDAELDLDDEYQEDIAEKMEQQIAKRDFGLATRFLYDMAMPPAFLDKLIKVLKLEGANLVAGGQYHNLKDLAAFPVKSATLSDELWPAVKYTLGTDHLWNRVIEQDIILHPPYHSYDTVLRFFNEAALDECVTEIYITLYRIAGDSRIAQALISAAKNGKAVTVFVELKARFDEANNIQWAKRMKAAGVKIIYSIPGLKVHAKVALVKRIAEKGAMSCALLATGNFNESTARFYTDHILFTAQPDILSELEQLFAFLNKRRKPIEEDQLVLQHLMIAQFNLLPQFMALMDAEINEARAGRPASVTLKMNNIEEKVLIDKLYEASSAGVKVQLIIRGICRLKPGIKGLSEHIQVRRIVDRYLEHGRIYIFHHGGMERIYMGSADWMSRNIYRRIEVCFPVYDSKIREQIRDIVHLQLEDNISAVQIDDAGRNIPLPVSGEKTRAQREIYKRVKNGSNHE